MLPVIRKSLKLCFYALAVLIGVIFCVSNRSNIELTLFPLPYALSLPVFLFAIVFFVTGMLMGRTFGSLRHIKTRKQHKAATERVNALENEIVATRTERLLRN